MRMRPASQLLCAAGLLATLFLGACSAPVSQPTPNALQATAAPATSAPTPPAATPVPDSTFTPPPGSRGATTPWAEYEAEDSVTNGEILAASRTFGEIAA